MNIFAKRLRDLRKSKGATQTQIGQIIGITKAGIYDIEKGRSKTTLDNACALADYFNVSLDYLVGRSDNTEVR